MHTPYMPHAKLQGLSQGTHVPGMVDAWLSIWILCYSSFFPDCLQTLMIPILVFPRLLRNK